MAQINPYIHFNGNAEEAFTFYKSVFGGTFAKVVRYKELAGTEYPIPENDANRLMHIVLPIGNSTVLLGSDVMEVMGRVTENDNRNTISINAGSRQTIQWSFNRRYH
jgi:PhnB protein